MRLAVALVNGLFTLVVLLIAPLGLASVITLTALIMVSTLVVDWAGDRLLLYLAGDRSDGRSPRTARTAPRRPKLPAG